MDTEGSLNTTMAEYAFRVNGPADGDKSIDNLNVGTAFAEAVPEPSSLALLLAGGLVLLRRKKQR